MNINNKFYRTVWMGNGIIHTINQLLLPEKFEIVSLNNYHDVANSIKTMIIRGAPAIGAMGAYGLAQAINQLDEIDLDKINAVKTYLFETRPTAHDLAHGLNFVYDQVSSEKDLSQIKKVAKDAAEEYADLSVQACKKIGELGNRLIKSGNGILTHCNAGALATVDWGTALAPIRMAHYEGKNVFVFVDETRPRLQGTKITAWELAQEGIPHAIIADNAAGFYLQKGDIHLVITGADRIAQNGDAANKIGTYEKAVIAKENNIPFYIAAPLSTIDFHCESGDRIPIEERDEKEVLELNNRRIAPLESPAKNPAFDITPARYITGIITEKGVFAPQDIHKLA